MKSRRNEQVLAPVIEDTTLKSCYGEAIKDQRSHPFQGRDKLREQVHSELETFAAKQDFYNRPYTAMIVAGIFAQLGQHEAALVQLETWRKRQQSSSIETKWLTVRALNIVIYLVEYWIRRDGANASIVLRDFQLKRLEDALKLVDALFDLQSELRASRQGRKPEDLDGAAFSRPPPKADECTDKASDLGEDAAKSRKRLYWWYINMYAWTVRHRLLHPEYARQHAHQANEAITDLLLADLGCAEAQPENKLAFRAWLLRMFASMQLQDTVALKEVRSRASLEAMLDRGLRASELGLLMVRAKAESQLGEKREGRAKGVLLEQLAHTPEIAAYEELLRVRQQLLQARKNLD